MLCLVITLTLFFILIPRYGLIGIGLSEILSVTFSIVISSIILFKKTSIHVFHRTYFINFIISLLSFIIINIIISGYSDIHSIYHLSLINIVVIIFLIVPNLLLLKREEINTLKSVFLPKK